MIFLLAPVPSILIDQVEPGITKMNLKWKDNKQVASNNVQSTIYTIRLFFTLLETFFGRDLDVKTLCIFNVDLNDPNV